MEDVTTQVKKQRSPSHDVIVNVILDVDKLCQSQGVNNKPITGDYKKFKDDVNSFRANLVLSLDLINKDCGF